MIEQVIETSKALGMITRNKSIQMLLDRGYINQQTAREYSFEVSDADQPQPGMGKPGMGVPRPPYGGAPMNNRR